MIHRALLCILFAIPGNVYSSHDDDLYQNKKITYTNPLKIIYFQFVLKQFNIILKQMLDDNEGREKKFSENNVTLIKTIQEINSCAFNTVDRKPQKIDKEILSHIDFTHEVILKVKKYAEAKKVRIDYQQWNLLLDELIWLNNAYTSNPKQEHPLRNARL